MKLINFYTLDRIQKRMPKQKDAQYEKTKMKIDSRILICGASGAGKTNAFFNYFYLTTLGKGTFDHVFLCYKLAEPLYDDLIEQLGEGISVYKSLKDFPWCSQFPEQVEKKYLLIFDDCITDQDPESVKKIEEYFTRSRKQGCTCVYLSQSYFKTRLFVRQNLSYVLLLSISGKRDLATIMEQFNLQDGNKKRLFEIYQYAIKKETPTDLSFLKIDCGNNIPENQKFSRGFDEFIEV